MDRASWIRRVCRDPDAMLDLVELELTPEIVEQQAKRQRPEPACNG